MFANKERLAREVGIAKFDARSVRCRCFSVLFLGVEDPEGEGGDGGVEEENGFGKMDGGHGAADVDVGADGENRAEDNQGQEVWPELLPGGCPEGVFEGARRKDGQRDDEQRAEDAAGVRFGTVGGFGFLVQSRAAARAFPGEGLDGRAAVGADVVRHVGVEVGCGHERVPVGVSVALGVVIAKARGREFRGGAICVRDERACTE